MPNTGGDEEHMESRQENPVAEDPDSTRTVLSASAKDIKSLQEELDLLRQQLVEARRKEERYKVLDEELVDIEANSLKVNAFLAQVKGENRRLTAENKQLKQPNSDQDYDFNTLATLNEKTDTWHTAYTKMEQSLRDEQLFSLGLKADMEGQTEEYKTLLYNNTQLVAKVESRDKAIQEHEEKISQVTLLFELSEHENLNTKKELGDLQRQLIDTNDELEQANEQLNRAPNNAPEEGSSNVEAELLLNDLKRQLEQLKLELSLANQANTQLASENAVQRKSANLQQQDTDLIKQALSVAQAQIKSLTEANETLRAEQLSKTENIEKRLERQAKLEAQATESKKTAASMAQQLAQQTDSIRDLTQRFQGLEQEKSGVIKQLQQNQSLLISTTETNQILASERDAALSESTHSASRLEALNTVLIESSQSKRDLSTQLSAAQDENRRLSQSIAGLQDTLEALKISSNPPLGRDSPQVHKLGGKASRSSNALANAPLANSGFYKRKRVGSPDSSVRVGKKKRPNSFDSLKTQRLDIGGLNYGRQSIEDLIKQTPSWLNPAFQASAKAYAEELNSSLADLQAVITGLEQYEKKLSEQLNIISSGSRKKSLQAYIETVRVEYLALRALTEKINASNLTKIIKSAKKAISDIHQRSSAYSVSFDDRLLSEKDAYLNDAARKSFVKRDSETCITVDASDDNSLYAQRDRVSLNSFREHIIASDESHLGRFIEERLRADESVETPTVKMTVASFPDATDPNGRFVYSMAMVTQLLAGLKEAPSQAKPLVLRGTNQDELACLYSALKFFGEQSEHMKFDTNAISVVSDVCSSQNVAQSAADFFNESNSAQFPKLETLKAEIKQLTAEKFGPPVEREQAMQKISIFKEKMQEAIKSIKQDVDATAKSNPINGGKK